MPAGINQIDFPWAMYRFKENKKTKTRTLKRICGETWGRIFLLFWWFRGSFLWHICPSACSLSHVCSLLQNVQFIGKLESWSNICSVDVSVSFLSVLLLSINGRCHVEFSFLGMGSEWGFQVFSSLSFALYMCYASKGKLNESYGELSGSYFSWKEKYIFCIKQEKINQISTIKKM